MRRAGAGGSLDGATVVVREVGPRDGLQPEAPLSVEARVMLVEALVDAGLRHVEVAAFVSPRAVPAMAGAAEVLAALGRRPGVTWSALVPNGRGAADALEAGVDELTATISASAAYNRRNVHMDVDESIAALAEVSRLAAAADPAVPVDAVVSCSFGSPYEGPVAPAEVAALAGRLLDGGCARCTFADTTGMASPRRVHDLLDALEGDGVAVDVGLHLHDTRGTALVNAYAGLERGVRRFDTAVGGLGGSPFAHGAGGNLATEELVALLDDLGAATGVDVEALVGVAAHLVQLVGHEVPSRVARHGPSTRLAAVGDGGAG
ncbi:MAG: hydroxymethylglutaryl-CoA lyase [Actinobacteria bacterium]|nr:hydroxymethylglutaryl-CoA lyase [Actinomycetota bacterium]